MTHPNFDRRSFIAGVTGAGLTAAAVGLSPDSHGAEDAMSPATKLDRRPTLENLQRCLGGPWPIGGPLEAKIESRVAMDGYTRERLSYLVEPNERINVYLLIPDGVTKDKPAPGICLWHQHAGQYDVGKDEPAGVKAPGNSQMHWTGVALAKEGYVVLCPDAAGFGERNKPPRADGKHKLRGGGLEHYLFGMYVVAGKCLAWKNILDMRRAVDYISSRPEVIADRLGCYGHSMGSTHTWQFGPWEPRLKALVGNCCMPTYAAIERTNLIHCFPNYVPGWRQFGDIPDIVSLIAPKPLHLNFGETDDGSPIEEVRAGMPVIERAYAAQNAADKFTYFIEEGIGHILSDAMWQRTKAHFAKYLRGGES